MRQHPISNDTLIALLDDCTFRFGDLPESFNGAAVIKLIQSRLKAAPCPAADLVKEQSTSTPSQSWSDMDTPDSDAFVTEFKQVRLVNPFSNYTFSDEFLEGAVTVYLEGCFVMDLSKFNNPLLHRAEEKRNNLITAIGGVFQLLRSTQRWPKDVRAPESVLGSISKQITVDNVRSIIGEFGTKLIVGNPVNIPRFNKTIDKEAIEALAEQLKELNRPYSGWTIQSQNTEAL